MGVSKDYVPVEVRAKGRPCVFVSHKGGEGTRRRTVVGRLGSLPDFLPDLQKDLVAVISKYVKINPEDIKVGLEKQGNFEVIEVNIVLPEIR